MGDTDSQQGTTTPSDPRWQQAQSHEAGFWRRINPIWAMPRLIRWHSAAFRTVELFLPDDARIIEIGAGPTCLSRLFTKGTKVYTDPLMDSYREHAADFLPEGEKLVAMGESIPFPDASFDAAVCLNALDHMSSPEDCLREIVRVLKPGGRLVLGMFTRNATLLALRRATEHVTTRASSAPHPNTYTYLELRALLAKHFAIESVERVHHTPGLLERFHREYWIFICRTAQ